MAKSVPELDEVVDVSEDSESVHAEAAWQFPNHQLDGS